MKARKVVMLLAAMLMMAWMLVGCTEVQVASTVKIDDANGKGSVTYDLPIDYSDGNAHYLPNGTEGLKNAVIKVLTDLGVEAEVTTTTEEKTNDGGQTYAYDHVYAKIEFDNIDEYNAIMKKLSGDQEVIAAEFYYDEASGGYVFKEHSTVFTNIVNNLRVLICADTENVNMAPEGQDAHTPDEAANSFYEWIYVGDGTSERFPHHDYRNESIGHTYMQSVGTFAPVDNNGGGNTSGGNGETIPDTGDINTAGPVAVMLIGVAVIGIALVSKKKYA